MKTRLNQLISYQLNVDRWSLPSPRPYLSSSVCWIGKHGQTLRHWSPSDRGPWPRLSIYNYESLHLVSLKLGQSRRLEERDEVNQSTGLFPLQNHSKSHPLWLESTHQPVPRPSPRSFQSLWIFFCFFCKMWRTMITEARFYYFASSCDAMVQRPYSQIFLFFYFVDILLNSSYSKGFNVLSFTPKRW